MVMLLSDIQGEPPSTTVYNAVEVVLMTYEEIRRSGDPILIPAAYGVAVELLKERLDVTLHTAALLIGGALEARGIDRP